MWEEEVEDYRLGQYLSDEDGLDSDEETDAGSAEVDRNRNDVPV